MASKKKKPTKKLTSARELEHRMNLAIAGNAKELRSMADVIERFFGWILEDRESISVVVDGRKRTVTREHARELAAAMRAQAKRFS